MYKRQFARKRGFTVPVGHWIAAEAGTLAPLVSAQPGVAALMPGSAARSVIEAAEGRGGLLAWRLLFYALWHQIHRRGANPRQPLADILAEKA